MRASSPTSKIICMRASSPTSKISEFLSVWQLLFYVGKYAVTKLVVVGRPSDPLSGCGYAGGDIGLVGCAPPLSICDLLGGFAARRVICSVDSQRDVRPTTASFGEQTWLSISVERATGEPAVRLVHTALALASFQRALVCSKPL